MTEALFQFYYFFSSIIFSLYQFMFRIIMCGQMDKGSRVFLPSPADCVPAYQRAVACDIS